MKSVVSIIRAEGYSALRSNIEQLVENLGGWEKFVRSGESALLKVNLLSARTPDRGVTTHPAVVKAVAECLLDRNVKVAIGDSPGAGDRGLERVFRNTGMIDVAEELGIPWVKFEPAGVREIHVSDEITLYLTKATDDYDHIINLPKLKTHSMTRYTGAIKNLFGLIPGLRKASYHKQFPLSKEFSRMLVAVYANTNVTLHIMDGIVGMEGNGPASGDLRDVGLLIASDDGVALDAIACHIIGIKEGKIAAIRFAAEQGLGHGKLSDIEVLGGELSEFVLEKPFVLPPRIPESIVPSWILRLFAKLVWFRPAPIDAKCTRCGICANHCPVNAITMRGSELPEYDYEKCITCLCCQELCPENAVELQLSCLAKRIG